MSREKPHSDRIDYPPVQRQFSSPSGDYSLTIGAVDGWKTPRAKAALHTSDGTCLWERDLPHHHGPRRVLITDDGRVLLVDEWINVVSRYALMLIGADGHTLACHSAEQIFSELAVPRRAITEHARHGVWITEGPMLSADTKSAILKVAGRSVRLRLEDGRLFIED